MFQVSTNRVYFGIYGRSAVVDHSPFSIKVDLHLDSPSNEKENATNAMKPSEG